MSDEKKLEEMQKRVQEMRVWLNSQPHLPKDVDDIILQRFVHSCYYDLERAKKAADLFFTIRGSSPDLMNSCRDPLSPQMKKALSIVNLAQLKISGNRNLWIWQLNDPGLDNYDYVQDARMFFLSTDSWLLEDTMMEEADLVLMDTKDITLKFLTKFNISVAKRLARYQEDAMPIRLKEIHVVNAPSFIDKLYGLMKPLLKQEVTDMMRFHVPKSETLFKHFTKEELPEDYGGTNGKMEDHMKDVLKSIVDKRDKLMEPNLWQSTDTKKSKHKKECNIEPDSFRSLDID